MPTSGSEPERSGSTERRRNRSLGRGRRVDPVTPEVAAEVQQRDARMTYRWYLELGLVERQIRALMMRRPLCVAAILDPRELESCSGRSTLDHVKTEPRMGLRAPSDPQHLVSLCEFHHLGSRGGSNWATAHRPALREYLRSCA